MRLVYVGVIALIYVAMGSPLRAQEGPLAVSGKELIERLTRLEEGQKSLQRQMEEGQKSLQRQMEEGQKSLQRQVDDLKVAIFDLRDFVLWGFGVTFAGMFALVGFVIWDRRSALAPAVRHIQEVEEREQRLEAALREYATKSPELADSLRKMGLL